MVYTERERESNEYTTLPCVVPKRSEYDQQLSKMKSDPLTNKNERTHWKSKRMPLKTHGSTESTITVVFLFE